MKSEDPQTYLKPAAALTFRVTDMHNASISKENFFKYRLVYVIKSVLFAKKKIVILVGLMSDAQSRPFAVEPQVMATLCTHLHQVCSQVMATFCTHLQSDFRSWLRSVPICPGHGPLLYTHSVHH
jgi:thymidine kinase